MTSCHRLKIVQILCLTITAHAPSPGTDMINSRSGWKVLQMSENYAADSVSKQQCTKF